MVWVGYAGATAAAAAVTMAYVMTRALYISGAGPRVCERERERDRECVPASEVGGVGLPRGAFKYPCTSTLSSSPIAMLILSRRERAKACF